MKRSRKQHLLPITTLILALWSLSFSSALAFNADLTLGGQYDRDLTGVSGHDNGAGGTALFEIEPLNILAVGLAGDLDGYFGVGPQTAPPLLAGSVDLTLRLMPWGMIDRLESYVLFAGGLNEPNGKALFDIASWSGQYHFLGAVGVKYFFDPHMAIDAAIGSNYYTPMSNPLATLSGRLGLSFYLLPAFGSPKDEEAPPKPAAPMAMPAPPPPNLLQRIALKELGDADLYPLIVDANFKDLNKPLALPPHTPLVIPSQFSKKKMLAAHQKAHQADYLRAASTFQDPTLQSKYGAGNK